jgi:hypothetical protein
MESSYRPHQLPPTTPPAGSTAGHRIAMPLARVLDFARREPDLHAPRQVAFALRPLLTLALSTAGLCQEQPEGGAARPGAAASPGRDATALGRKAARSSDLDGESELLFTALSSLIEVVRNLTPAAGKIYAQLGHRALPAGERAEGPYAAAGAPRSEVVIELISDANGGRERVLTATAAGALAFELSVVAAIVESKGGQLSWHADGGPACSFVVRLPVLRS